MPWHYMHNSKSYYQKYHFLKKKVASVCCRISYNAVKNVIIPNDVKYTIQLVLFAYFVPNKLFFSRVKHLVVSVHFILLHHENKLCVKFVCTIILRNMNKTYWRDWNVEIISRYSSVKCILTKMHFLYFFSLS